MQRLTQITPAQTGMALFVIAAGVLISVIACSLLGFTAGAQTLMKVAEPACSSAVAVLVYLGIMERGVTKALELDED